MVASAYLVEEVSGSRPGRVIPNTLKIVPAAALFSAEQIKVRVEAVITFSVLTLGSPGYGLKSQLGWLPFGVKAQRYL